MNQNQLPLLATKSIALGKLKKLKNWNILKKKPFFLVMNSQNNQNSNKTKIKRGILKNYKACGLHSFIHSFILLNKRQFKCFSFKRHVYFSVWQNFNFFAHFNAQLRPDESKRAHHCNCIEMVQSSFPLHFFPLVWNTICPFLVKWTDGVGQTTLLTARLASCALWQKLEIASFGRSRRLPQSRGLETLLVCRRREWNSTLARTDWWI